MACCPPGLGGVAAAFPLQPGELYRSPAWLLCRSEELQHKGKEGEGFWVLIHPVVWNSFSCESVACLYIKRVRKQLLAVITSFDLVFS